MTDEAKRVAETIKQACDVFAAMELPMAERECTLSYDAAMTLVEELEQVKQERDGLSIMLTSATSAAETYKRERDAAVEALRTKAYYCETCAHYTPGYFCSGCRNKSN